MRNQSRALLAVLLCPLMLAGQSQLPIVERPHGAIGWRSYLGTTVAPINPGNSARIYSLIHAGNIYLTIQDALALAIENNLNLEVDRYALPTADWNLEREQAGGPIRGLSSGAPQVGISDSGIGVLGALAAGGFGSGGGGTSSVGGGGGAILQQVGPVVVNFDPSLTGSYTYQHETLPFANVAISGVNPLVDSNINSTTQVQQGLDQGGSVIFRNYYFKTKENAPGDSLNPSIGPYDRVHFQQPLLQGFGSALNSRRIRVARNGLTSARETFRGQVLTLAATVLNQYWGVVSAGNEYKLRERAVEVTQKFYDQTKFEIGLGALPRVELPKYETEVSARKRDLILADSTLRQQEEALKQMLVRREDPTIEAARIVPMDAMEIPDRDDLPSLAELVKTAMENRPDVAVSKITDENAIISALGTANGLLPVAIAYADTYNRGASGVPQPSSGVQTASNFVGGYGTSLGQIFRRDFPTEYAGIQLSGFPVHNRQSQADYGIEQLQLQASQISSARDNNAIAVNVSNQLIALQQARARYSTAINTRKLQEQILEDDQRKFSYGTATFNNLIIDERALVAAQISENGAQASYVRARAQLDQVVGRTLDVNHVSLDEAIHGQISRPSQLPDSVGNAPKPQQQTKNK